MAKCIDCGHEIKDGEESMLRNFGKLSHLEPCTIQTRVDAYLVSLGVSAIIELRGDACPTFCEDKGKPGLGTFPRRTHIHGQHWQMSVSRSGHPHNAHNIPLVVDFWDSYRDAEIRKTGNVSNWPGRQRPTNIQERRDAQRPSRADILSCCSLSSIGCFDDFCSEFGYDNDSRKAERIYNACADQARDFARMFNAAELNVIQTMLQDL